MKTRKFSVKTLVISMTAAMAGLSAAQAKDLPRIDVVGEGREAVAKQPGAVSMVTQQEIEQAQPRSTEDVLRRVPGIYVKGEEESAVVVNVGVRGLPAGDYKTLVLEDGVPVQPGIFVGNSRYFNPRMQRMAGAEVLKGASSLRYGPNTIGGVINYQTKTPEDGASISGKVGSWNTKEATLELGGSNPSGDAYFGLLYTKAESDGFQNKGYKMDDLLVKAGTAISDDQMISVKFSHTENDANISYRGLFPDAFEAKADFNPAPDDYYLSGRTAFDLNHEWDVNEDMSLQTLVYWSEMSREYWRFNLDSPSTETNSAGHTVWNYADTVNGMNRDFKRIGAESRLSLAHNAFGMTNQAQFGVRFMTEEMVDTAGNADRATPRNRTTNTKNIVDSADSLAMFVENRFDVSDRLAVTAGLRMESYEQRRNDLRKSDPTEKYSNSEFMPGVGATYQLNPEVQLYGSVYQAFAPPLVGSVVGSGDIPTEAEKSINIEFGARGVANGVQYEVTAFQMDFSNQVDPGNSLTGDAPNEGSALIQGLEAAFGYRFVNGMSLDTNLTWIPTAEFGEDRNSGGAKKGNRFDYSPELIANVKLGYQTGGLKTALLLNHTGSVYADKANTKALTTDKTGLWGGELDAYTTLDLTADYKVNKQLNVFGAIKNLTDEHYIAGLRQGIYAGPERSFELGAKYKF
jgi:Fe(3+) dicitrate transport protein